MSFEQRCVNAGIGPGFILPQRPIDPALEIAEPEIALDFCCSRVSRQVEINTVMSSQPHVGRCYDRRHISDL